MSLNAKAAIGTLVVLAFGVFAMTAEAATCAFGSLVGSRCTVTGTDFNVEYNLGDVGLYGDARIIGNNVIFTPTSFGAVSQDGGGTDNTSSQVIIDILVTNPAFALDELNLIERGRYQLNGAGSTVNHTGGIDAFDLTNFSFLSDSIDETAPLNINDNQTHNWDALGSIDFLADPGHIFSTQGAQITINNSLQAFTQSGVVPSFASIEKTFQQQVVILGVNSMPPPLAPVPVPPAVWLFGSSLLCLLALKRKFRQS